MAPARTPRPIVQKLYREMAGIAQAPEARKMFVSQGNEVVASTPEEFARTVRDESRKWSAIGKRIGVKLN